MSSPSNESDQEDLVPMETNITADQFDYIEELAHRTGYDREVVHRRLLDLGIAESRRSENEPETQEDHS